MKTLVSSRQRFAGVVLVLGLGMAMTQADAPASSAGPVQVSHSRISVHRHEDGRLKRGIRNEVETSNWSGYAVANFSTGATYTAAQASWTVPSVSYVGPPPVCQTYRFGKKTYQYCSTPYAPWEYSASWVGIGGYCQNANCTSVDSTLIQLGTEQDVSSRGATESYAWIELLPNYPIVISPSYPNCNSLSCAYPVHPGDAITASLSCQSHCTPGAAQTWLLTMTNAGKWSWSTTIPYASSLLSAVWIQEAPASSGGILPLADFTTIGFDPTVGANAPPNFPPGLADAILMVDPYGETSSPSVPEVSPNLDAFNTCWGNNANAIATCPAP